MSIPEHLKEQSWRSIFKEPELAQLIDTALTQNVDIRTACLNVEQADAELKATRLSWLPSLHISLEGGITKPLGSLSAYSYNIPLSMQWENNIYSQIHQQKAAKAIFSSSEELVRSIQIQIIAAIASQYYSLVSAFQQVAITQQHIELIKKTIDIMESMKDFGLTNEVAISQTKAELYEAIAAETNLKQQIKSYQNNLLLLMGPKIKTDYHLNEESLIVFTPQVRAITSELNLPCSAPIPLANLALRPDVRAAENDLLAMIENIGIARAGFYPTINISANFGWTNDIGEIINPGKLLLNLLGSIIQPLFNQGRNVANLRIAKAKKEQALVTLHQTLLTAGTELIEAQTACLASHEIMLLHSQQNEAILRALEISTELMTNGDVSYLEVLTAQRTLLQNNINLANDKLSIIQGQINLYKALGGNIGDVVH